MEHAIKFVELTNDFINTLLKTHKSVTRLEGRRFDRIQCDDTVRFFIDRNSWEIFGAKSSFQYNPRRVYGTLDVTNQYDWSGILPKPMSGSSAERIYNEREAAIVKNYKPRGRPRKVKSAKTVTK